MIEQAITRKETTRTGRAIGKKSRAEISLKINDEDRNISRLWETVKRYYSKRKQTAAETARRVVLRGLAAELEDITIQKEIEAREAAESKQMRLFE